MTQPAPPARHSATRLLTIQATADHLDLSTKSVRRLISRGELVAHRIGRSVRIAEEDLRVFLAQRRIY
jgi:excisionase family DNA binding protein